MYAVGIYARLSVDFHDRKNESIETQIAIAKEFIKKQNDMVLFDCYIDIGKTGTNFDREGFERMMKDARMHKINCIIVKDLSRFGRNYIEIGNYLEKIFPYMGIRFISVNDAYDSKNYKEKTTDLDINFKNLLYDLYSQDLSQKIRSALSIRKEEGQYISGTSPFGYEKNAEDRHCLQIAEEEAKIVKQIFSLAMEGYTSTQIAKLFNETHVKTPLEFKIEKGKSKRKPKGETFLWSSSSICQILKNEIYIGNMVQKKYEKDFVGGKTHIKPRTEWLVSEHHHEPIVEKSVFDKVQKRHENKKKENSKTTHPLVGTLICGYCHRNLHYRKDTSHPYFTCCHRYTNTRKNCIAKIDADFLETLISQKIMERLGNDKEFENLYKHTKVELEKEKEQLTKKRQQLDKELQRIKQQSFKAYREYILGNSDSFHSCQIMVESIEDKLTQINKRIQKLENTQIKQRDKTNKISKEWIEHEIDKIIVYNKQHIEILWKKKEDSL